MMWLAISVAIVLALIGGLSLLVVLGKNPKLDMSRFKGWTNSWFGKLVAGALIVGSLYAVIALKFGGTTPPTDSAHLIDQPPKLLDGKDLTIDAPIAIGTGTEPPDYRDPTDKWHKLFIDIPDPQRRRLTVVGANKDFWYCYWSFAHSAQAWHTDPILWKASDGQGFICNGPSGSQIQIWTPVTGTSEAPAQVTFRRQRVG